MYCLPSASVTLRRMMPPPRNGSRIASGRPHNDATATPSSITPNSPVNSLSGTNCTSSAPATTPGAEAAAKRSPVV